MYSETELRDIPEIVRYAVRSNGEGSIESGDLYRIFVRLMNIDAIAESISSLYEEMKQVFSDSLASKWSMTALDFVFTNPVFRNKSDYRLNISIMLWENNSDRYRTVHRSIGGVGNPR